MSCNLSAFLTSCLRDIQQLPTEVHELTACAASKEAADALDRKLGDLTNGCQQPKAAWKKVVNNLQVAVVLPSFT
jgi:hypothetical protein